MTLVFESISKRVFDARQELRWKTVLTEASAVVRPDDVLAVMGPSGSGKSTLLQILGGRNLKDMSGKVTLGGKLFCRSMRRRIAFILQDDVFLPSKVLTVRDHLVFAASVKMGRHHQQHAVNERVNEVIELLNLQTCADTPLLLVSGGERKRTSIGMEIIPKTSLLLVDEGTSGLDSASAATLMSTVKSIARAQHIPAVVAIHQPSTPVFMLFDKVLLLCDGRTVYYGKPPSTTRSQWFQKS